MRYKIYSFFLSLLLIPALSEAQELSKHQWKDRVLLVFGDSPNIPSFQEQINQLASDSKGSDERRLVIYQILPGKYSLGFADNNWIKVSKIYQQFMTSGDTFQIILVGLDGAIKLRQNEPVIRQTLFALIDAMPMRANELKSGNGG